MRIRERFDSRIPKWLGVGAIVLYPFILYAEKEPHRTTIKHEWVHVEQIRRVGFFRFYISYMLFYIAFRLSGISHQEAYLAIPYEVEAYKKTY